MVRAVPIGTSTCSRRTETGDAAGHRAAITRGILQLLPNARLDALAGASHGMLDSYPEAVAGMIAG